MSSSSSSEFHLEDFLLKMEINVRVGSNYFVLHNNVKSNPSKLKWGLWEEATLNIYDRDTHQHLRIFKGSVALCNFETLTNILREQQLDEQTAIFLQSGEKFPKDILDKIGQFL